MLHTIPGLTVYRRIQDLPRTEPVPGRVIPPVYALSGALQRGVDGYDLAVQRADARTDSVLYTYRVRGSTVSEAVHRMAVQIAMSFGLPLPVHSTPSHSDDP